MIFEKLGFSAISQKVHKLSQLCQHFWIPWANLSWKLLYKVRLWMLHTCETHENTLERWAKNKIFVFLCSVAPLHM